MKKLFSDNVRGRSLLKLTLLFTGSMTVLAGAGITAAIPEIENFFSYHENAALYSKLILTVPALFIAILAPFAGQVIDRFGRKKLLIVSLFIYALAGTSGLYLSNIYLLLLGRALLGVGVAGIMTVNTTLIGDYFQGKVRSRFMGWQGAFMAFGGVVFVSVGGLLADFSWRMPFLVYSFSLLILIFTLFYIYEPDVMYDEGKESKPESKRRKVKIRLVYVTSFFGMLFFYMIPTQIPFILSNTGNISSSEIGYSISLAILAGAILSVNYGRIRMKFNFFQIYMFTFFLMGLGFLVISFSNSTFLIISGLIIAGFGTGLLMPNSNLWLISLAQTKHRGRMVGILNLFVYSGQFLSPIVVFPFIQWKSIYFSFAAGGFFMIIMAIYFFLLCTGSGIFGRGYNY